MIATTARAILNLLNVFIRLLRICRSGIPVLDPVAATAEDLGRVHKAGYLSWLRSLSPFPVTGTTKDPDLAAIQWFIDADTYITPWSYDVATYAAGAACRAADRARDGESCFAFVRPPGHHALPGWAMGFCIINNVAVAAARALDSVDKVAIIDWDLHHGNGTQEIFVKSDRVVYCSVHAEGLFPYSGAAVEIGTGPGAGYTVNAPLMPGSTIGDVAHVFTDLFSRCWNGCIRILSWSRPARTCFSMIPSVSWVLFRKITEP